MLHEITTYWKGVLLCFFIALPAWFLGKLVPVAGSPVFAMVFGMLLTACIPNKKAVQQGVNFTAKKILQYAVVLLGFNLNFSVIMKTGQASLPIIVSTIATALITAYFFSKMMKLPPKTSMLIGIGSSICGGSAIAATAPVIEAQDDEVAEAVSVIFLFNVIAALIFPSLGSVIGLSNEGFGLFAGTAVNDTSSVTAAASAWDGMHGSNALEIATVVKLTRTLAIIPITLVLAVYQLKRKNSGTGQAVSFKKIFPLFIVFFLLASIFSTVFPLSAAFAHFVKNSGKFCIVMAMSAIGFNTNVIKLIISGGKSIALGLCCWASITGISLLMQKVLGMW